MPQLLLSIQECAPATYAPCLAFIEVFAILGFSAIRFQCATSQCDLWHFSGPRRSSRNDWKKLQRGGNTFKLLRSARGRGGFLSWDVSRSMYFSSVSTSSIDYQRRYYLVDLSSLPVQKEGAQGCWRALACTCANHFACTCPTCIIEVCTREWLSWSSHDVFSQIEVALSGIAGYHSGMPVGCGMTRGKNHWKK